MLSSTVVDLYMKPKEARIYASKSEASVKEGLAWLGASFIPGAGPYLSVIGFINTSERSELSSNIRKYTNKDQSVHITIMKDEKYKFSTYVVKKWDGKKSSIKPFKTPAPQYLNVLYKKYKY
ncbi:hypothetical protein [Bacillus sp. FJAT-49736]|uniref:hypothetical protein n=1 Tax=Bacillus sp. FJAT-49736 TaxID=2833582 RepID=UPI001BC9AF49|nr:hypothetical protein [Bacillus sp. FJAT-49736]MBS4173997.1 hypothetical protein [Bacillus sp. FJAT-49736]